MYDFAHALSDAIEGITHSLCTLEFEDHRPLYDWVVAKCPEVRDDAWVLGCLSKAGGNPEDYRASPETPTPLETEPPLNLCGNQPVRRVHAIEQASRRWRGGGCEDSARTRRKLDFHTGRNQRPAHPAGLGAAVGPREFHSILMPPARQDKKGARR